LNWSLRALQAQMQKGSSCRTGTGLINPHEAKLLPG
jgi:hypothetical protein